MPKSVWKRTTGALALCLVALATSAAHAEDTGDASRAKAAPLFERGVREFEAQDYAAAARTFLQVDSISPSGRALSNALAAARRAGLHRVVVEIVERSNGRADLEPDARKLFERALIDAAQNLSRIEVTCRPAPCQASLDGTALSGPRYVEPGEHAAAAESGVARDTRQLQCAAGATCTTEFVLVAPAAIPPPATSPAARVTRPAAATTPAGEKPLPPWVFVAGAAATVGLAGVTVWSGLDTLAARERHEPASPAYDPDDIRDRARRTDYLLAGTALLAGATAVAGVFFVDWNGKTARARVALLPGGGALFSAAREF